VKGDKPGKPPAQRETQMIAAFPNPIDHYLGLLYDVDLAPEKRAMITKKLMQEEDNLAHDFEQLEFAEKKGLPMVVTGSTICEIGPI